MIGNEYVLGKEMSHLTCQYFHMQGPQRGVTHFELALSPNSMHCGNDDRRAKGVGLDVTTPSAGLVPWDW